jgi:hypothetical protein
MATSPKPESVEAPVVDQERLAAVYEELQRMVIKLDANPIMFGPTRFNNRIAQVRSMLSRVEQLFLQVSEDLHWYKRKIRGLTTLYELEKRERMINDPKCRMGRSQGEREALADIQLRHEIEEIQELAAKAEDLEIIMVAIKSKRTDLKDIQGRMRDQMKMVDQDLGMGARWGKREAPSHASDFSDSDHIDSLLSAVDADMGITEDDEEVEEEDEVSDTEAADTEVVILEPHDPAPLVEDRNLSFSLEESEVALPEEPEILPEEGAVGSFEDDPQAAGDIDAFLDALDPTPSEVKVADLPDEGSIEDLISSLAEF